MTKKIEKAIRMAANVTIDEMGNVKITPLNEKDFEPLSTDGKMPVVIVGKMQIGAKECSFAPRRESPAKQGIRSFADIIRNRRGKQTEHLYVTESEVKLSLTMDRSATKVQLLDMMANFAEEIASDSVKHDLSAYCDELKKQNDECRTSSNESE